MTTHWHDSWFFPFGGLLFILLALALIVGVALWARRRHPRDGTETASSILDERLAKGEITQEEHARLREVLRR